MSDEQQMLRQKCNECKKKIIVSPIIPFVVMYRFMQRHVPRVKLSTNTKILGIFTLFSIIAYLIVTAKSKTSQEVQEESKESSTTDVIIKSLQVVQYTMCIFLLLFVLPVLLISKSARDSLMQNIKAYLKVFALLLSTIVVYLACIVLLKQVLGVTFDVLLYPITCFGVFSSSIFIDLQSV